MERARLDSQLVGDRSGSWTLPCGPTLCSGPALAAVSIWKGTVLKASVAARARPGGWVCSGSSRWMLSYIGVGTGGATGAMAPLLFSQSYS